MPKGRISEIDRTRINAVEFAKRADDARIAGNAEFAEAYQKNADRLTAMADKLQATKDAK